MNKSISATDLLKYDIKPFLYGALFSRIMPVPSKNAHPEYFYCYTSFRVSKAVSKYDFSFQKYANELIEQYNEASGYDNWTPYRVTDKEIELRFYIKNTLSCNSSEFFNIIYKKLIQCDWLYADEINEQKKFFVRGYMETRGSVDTDRPLFAQDYYYNNKFELNRLSFFTDRIGIPIAYLNFNPREMQPDYVSGKSKRNTQFRINIFWYAKEIGFINKYKAQVFANAHSSKIADTFGKDGVIYSLTPVPKMNYDATFIKMLNYFCNNIFGKELSKQRVEFLRNELGFNSQQNESIKPNRQQDIVSIFENYEEDKCALCGTTKTYTKSNGRQGFEIHHMIPFHNGRQYDNIANLVKLCSNCHGSLKKGRASKEQQLNNIRTILHKKSQVFDYVSAALGEDDINKIAEIIFELLG